MNFSLHQWLLTIALDILLKAGLLFLLSAIALGAAPISIFVSAALVLSMLHLISLGIAAGFVSLFDLARDAKFVLTLGAAEMLFASGVSFFMLVLVSQDVSKCPGHTHSCPWTQITSAGIWSIVGTVVILVVLNLLPILISTSVGRLVSRIRAKTIVLG